MANLKIKPVQYVTGEVVLIYPNLKEAKPFKEGDIPKFGTQILLRPETNQKDIDNINSIVQKLAKEAKLKNGYHNPLKNGNDINQDRLAEDKHELDYLKDNYRLRTSSQFEVKVVDGKKKDFEFIQDSDINGYLAKVIMNFVPYKNGTSFGVTSYLQAVQVIKSELKFGVSLDAFSEYNSNDDEIEEKDDDELPF